MNRKTKTKTAQLRLKLSYTALRFNPARLWGVENVVKGRDKRRKERAALDNIFNAMPPSVFFTLDNAVGVIDVGYVNAGTPTKPLTIDLLSRGKNRFSQHHLF